MDAMLKLAEEVGQVLKQKGWMLATAESCTGGAVAQAITAVAGSSEWFVGGVIAYANDCKTSMLNVPASLIEDRGAVSESVAIAMVQGALISMNADVAVSTTGIAGPTGGVPDKPVGTVWMACATCQGVLAECKIFAGDRHAVRAQATEHAMRMILRVAK